MELKCTINNKEYKIEQGATFVENYNETLDSGTLSIVHISKIKELQPYNDVFIYDYNYRFVGYLIPLPGISVPFSSSTLFRIIFKDKNGTKIYIEESFTVSETNSKDITFSYSYFDENNKPVEPFFFKHLLVDTYKETQIRIGKPIYNYEIDLCSEISKLEKVSVPNISITMDLKNPKSCWFYLQQYVKLYSPKIKIAPTTTDDTNDLLPEDRTWQYYQKYVLDPSLYYVFKDVACPEMSWSNPSLRDVLSQIMIVKDMIPYVENDVIKGLDITKTTGYFETNNPSCSFMYGNMDKKDFATDARREYSGAISNENSARLVEFLGFRQPNNGIMSLYNMVLETRYPIYKINRLLMCYYKKLQVNGEDKVFLCKQDITDFVLLDTVRNTLKTDWKAFRDAILTNDPAVIKEFQLATVGYSIGSKTISGWGTYYEYPTVLWFNNSRTYIENLVELCGKAHPYGIYNRYTFGLTDADTVDDDYPGSFYQNYTETEKIIAYKKEGETYRFLNISNHSDRYKTMFFEMDYIAMFNGAVIHSKDDAIQDDIVTSDNCNASLSILEADGLFEKEKVNRLGNKMYRIPTRYRGEDGYWQMQNYNHKLGAVIPDTFDIIYSREYSILNQEVKGSFSACHDYVMKNYFTSVWAKYRTYSLIPYSESVVRSENIRELILLSKDKSYYEKTDIDFDVSKMVSAFAESVVEEGTGFVDYTNVLNAAIIKIDDNEFLSDINAFACGYSLCLNLRTYDNIAAGNYISALHDDEVNSGLPGGSRTLATTQAWYSMVSDKDNAFIENITFAFCHMNLDIFGPSLKDFQQDKDLIPYSYEMSYKMPKLDYEIITELENETGINISDKTNIISSEKNICKDNKEVIDMTYQFEFYSNDKDIIVTPYLSKLNDLISTQALLKFEEPKNVVSEIAEKTFQSKTWCYKNTTGIYLNINKSFIDDREFLQYDQIAMDNPITMILGTMAFTGSMLNVSMTVPYATIKLKQIISGSLTPIPTLTISCEIKEYAKTIRKQTYPTNLTETTEFIRTRELSLVFTLHDSDSYAYYLRSDNIFSMIFRDREVGLVPGYYIFDYNMVEGKSYYARESSVWNDLTSLSSLMISGSFWDVVAYKVFKDKSMYVAISTNKLDKHLLQDNFKYSQLEDYVFDAFFNHLNCKKNEDTYFLISQGSDYGLWSEYIRASNYFVPMVLEDGRNVIQVLASQLPTYLKEIAKSIQYWWKDDDGVMHLVFGLNIDEMVDTNIYVSATKQRSAKVYNLNHVYMGDVTNYNETIAYQQNEEKQYYTNGGIQMEIAYTDGTETGEVYYYQEGSDEIKGPVDEYILN